MPFALLALLSAGSPARGDEPLPRRIDALVQNGLKAAKISASPRSDDADFLRRVYLDLIGRIPTKAQALTFLDSTDADKRTKLIDELLARPEYGTSLAARWGELIVDRSDDKHNLRAFKLPAFETWLAAEFNKGAGWDAIVSAMLTAEGEIKNNPAGVLIMSNRVNGFPRPEDVASMASRLFMGLPLRCAQCHDHPYVDEWKQKDFWGVAAFFGQVRDHKIVLSNGNENLNPSWSELPNPNAVSEKAYAQRLRAVGQIPPAPGPKIAIPRGSDPDDVKAVMPAKFFLAEAPTLPETGPYRPTFAAWLTAKDNPYFARAAVNRLWAHFFARGLVNPIDDMGPNNPASHPELLQLLEREFKEANFDFKVLMRSICLSETYQRSSRPTKDNADDQEWFSHMPIRTLNPHQLLESYSLALGRTVPINFGNRDIWTAQFMTQDPDEPATKFSHGIPQFLQMMNGSLGTNFVLPVPVRGKSKADIVTDLYLCALSRRPRPEELERMLAHIDRRLSAKAAVYDRAFLEVYWVLLNSAEFVFNR